jgi:hypothetical protein
MFSLLLFSIKYECECLGNSVLHVCGWTVTFFTLLWDFKHHLSTNKFAVRWLQELKVGRVNHQVDLKACNYLPDCIYSSEDRTESSLPCKPQILCLVRNVAPYYINENEFLILQIILHSSVIPSCLQFFCDMLYLFKVLYRHDMLYLFKVLCRHDVLYLFKVLCRHDMLCLFKVLYWHDMLYLFKVLYQHDFLVGNHLIDRQPFDECEILYKFE